ncbi:MAG: hypothetical protein D6814_13030 [Calditrichaeota bacterium]|nr:MAG: hypothetical protein D6814_13030 [Calditrichota bacterium]
MKHAAIFADRARQGFHWFARIGLSRNRWTIAKSSLHTQEKRQPAACGFYWYNEMKLRRGSEAPACVGDACLIVSFIAPRRL